MNCQLIWLQTRAGLGFRDLVLGRLTSLFVCVPTQHLNDHSPQLLRVSGFREERVGGKGEGGGGGLGFQSLGL